MTGLPNRLRAIRYEPAFDDALGAIRGDDAQPGRVDDIVQGVEWAVATAEDVTLVAPSVEVEGLTVYVAKSDPAPPQVPALRFFFTVDDDDTTVMMRFVESDPTYEDVG